MLTIALQKWLNSGKFLPEFMRDFHDQKEIFKGIHLIYDDKTKQMPSWVSAHQYVIDWFLWFMASRGYTLQKARKKGIEFLDFPNVREIEAENLKLMLANAEYINTAKTEGKDCCVVGCCFYDKCYEQNCSGGINGDPAIVTCKDYMPNEK